MDQRTTAAHTCADLVWGEAQVKSGGCGGDRSVQKGEWFLQSVEQAGSAYVVSRGSGCSSGFKRRSGGSTDEMWRT